MKNKTEFPILSPALQVGFYQRLVEAQNCLLLPALLDHVSKINLEQVDQELHRLVGREKLSYLPKKVCAVNLYFLCHMYYQQNLIFLDITDS